MCLRLDRAFQSLDPLGFAGGDANLYRYVGNGPMLFASPNGETIARGSIRGSRSNWLTTTGWEERSPFTMQKNLAKGIRDEHRG